MQRDGSLGHCPVCRTTLPAQKEPYGEIRCPRCSCGLWHLALTNGPTFFVQRANETIYDFLADLAGSRHGLTAADFEQILREADPLDVIELLLEI